ncbi:type I-E CRISPR-associated protein Cse1/CasA [Methylotuvimicrobium buryatense]|uniref:Type I-E CRISPR-associated protein Cse1/CasA n=1 Tax=Methylotuvimicrobium buryatense TaxID=95641 RepID=A0A4P9US16_METBY|nr:type I-E CRISPR-associated protein Cse1/CasA [Methylotuvimicrobium buryatense]QCW84309.1 type I-E CRISPR-associated protein Cse1/CasA [Methylotuvimicrobium buryatense]
MNLVTDPWLPVTNSKNQLCYISLNQLFEQSDEWLDLALRPHERISVMRFLICLAQAGLGLLEEDEWDDALDIIPGKCLYYLQNWQGSFNLFDSKKPFLQIAELEPFNKEPTYTTKLNFSLATGSNSTLFDHGCINPFKETSPRQMEASALVVSLITFNNFSLGGLYPQAKWKNKVTSKSGVKDAPCASQSMLHCFVRKHTIVKTLHANTLTIQQIKDRYGDDIGVPVWEFFPVSPDDKDAVLNATHTYLGRLVPISRWLKLLPDKKTMLMGEGFIYPVHPEFVETTAVLVVNKQKDANDILGCKTATPWRELCALTAKRKGKTFGGPAAIENQSKSEGYDLQILALKREQASVLDGFESVLHVPSYFTNSDENRAAYNDGVKKAEIMAFRLDEAIQIYLSMLMPQMIEIVSKKINKQPLSKHESEKYRAIKSRVKEKYLAHYWTLIEKQRHLLMQYISLLGMGTDQAREDSKKAWLKAINQAATETYETLCNHDSPRQLRAYVAGWHLLHPIKSESQEAA